MPGQHEPPFTGWQPQAVRTRPPGALALATSRTTEAGPGTDTLASANAGAPETVPSSQDEPTHVEGAAADLPAAAGWAPAPETVPLAAAALLALTIPGPELHDTPAGGGAVPVQLPGSDIVTEIPIVAAAGAILPLPEDHPSAMDAATAPPATASTLAAERVAWRDPVSVPGAAVLAMGAATVVLSDFEDAALPEPSAASAGTGRARVAAAGAAVVKGAAAG